MPTDVLGRREALKILSTTVLGYYLGTGCTRQYPLESSTCFPQSVASGDPRAERVILWTRVVDRELLQEDYPVLLEVAKDEACHEIVWSQTYLAEAALDHCLRIKVGGLEPATYYYYRFTYAGIRSRTGRTRTLPAEEDMRSLSLAMVYGQDYVGRYYNPYAYLLRHHDPDLILHLGDYVYESTGDPTFQVRNPSRNVIFRDSEHAQKIEWDTVTFYLAESLENYRQLYRTYRSDPMLQKLHERHPMIAIWDDHEYKDDYAGGDAEEKHNARRAHARRAYLEYMPLEIGLEEASSFTSSNALLDDEAPPLKLYRDFSLGGLARLLVSDYRTYRPDALIPMDAFPGTVFADEEEIRSLYEGHYPGEGETHCRQLSTFCSPYIDLQASTYANYRSIFKKLIYEMYVSEGAGFIGAGVLAARAAGGKMNVLTANKLVVYYNEHLKNDKSPLPLLYEEEGDEKYLGYARGLSYLDLGKYALMTRDGVGVTTLVSKMAFDVYAMKYPDQNVYGEEQSRWIQSCIGETTQPWLLFASSVSMTPMTVDLSDMDVLPDAFRQPIYINLDQFDGFPSARAALMETFRGHNALVLSGDIHAAFITDHGAAREITGPAVSSDTAREMLHALVATNPALENKEAILKALDDMDIDAKIIACNRNCVGMDTSAVIHHADVEHHGYTMIELEAEHTMVTLHTFPFRYATQNLYEKISELDRLVISKKFVFEREG